MKCHSRAPLPLAATLRTVPHYECNCVASRCVAADVAQHLTVDQKWLKPFIETTTRVVGQRSRLIDQYATCLSSRNVAATMWPKQLLLLLLLLQDVASWHLVMQRITMNVAFTVNGCWLAGWLAGPWLQFQYQYQFQFSVPTVRMNGRDVASSRVESSQRHLLL